MPWDAPWVFHFHQHQRKIPLHPFHSRIRDRSHVPNMGGMAVKISVLTVALNAMIALCIVLEALSVWLLRKA
jgi:UDP-N-acetylmuramyl pentapeptide phosphotransferase/UDP-N-acetylglucosamine-1-phosphate transferase